MPRRFVATVTHARFSRQGSTLIEMLTVIVILGILLALAAPYIISDMHRSQDTETKRSLSLAFVALKKNALATTNSDCSPYAPPCVPATDTARQELQTALPTSTFTDGLPSKSTAVSGHIGVETDAQNEAVLCVKSDSGNFFSIRYVSNGTNAGTYYGAGDSCTDGSNPATPGIPYDTGSGPNPTPAGQGTNECTGDEWSCGAGSPASGGGGGSGGSDVSNPVNLTLPAISGNPGDTPGNTLTVSTGTWDTDFPPSSYTYQWYRNGVSISGATNNTYIDTASDMNTELTVGVTAFTASGGQTTVFSNQFLAANPPTSSAVPTISGTVKDANTLTATTGSWNGTPPFSYSYQWQTSTTGTSGWTALSGATSSTYTIQSGDVGNYLRAEVTATNSAGSNVADSAATVKVTNSAPINTSLPTISDANGAPVDDTDTLNGANGSWTGTGPYSYTYQWERCNSAGASCSNIGSATTINYTVVSADVGSTIRLAVTATGPGGSTTATSTQTTVVDALPPVGPSSPTIQSFYPTQAPVGNHVTILGSNLTGTTGITVNGTSVVTFTVVNDDDIDFVIPTGATTGKITVTTPQGSATSNSNLTIGAVSGALNINDFAPSSGTVGTAVGISGYGLTGTTAVKFNGTSAAYQVVSNYDIVAIVPPGATTGKISVTNGSTVSSANNFTVTSTCSTSCNPPVISSFYPTTGAVGSHVSILGSDFIGATSVKLNGTTATFTVLSNNLVDMTVPAGATSGTISLTTPKGTATSLATFTVGACASCSFGINDFDPQFGPVGTVVGISGYGFAGATSVKFNGISAPFSVFSTSSIVTVVPAGATTGLITVTNGSTVSSAIPFTVTTPPSSGGPTVSDTTGPNFLVGDVLTSTTGTWIGTTPIVYSYQWQRCNQYGNACAAIGGATSSGYTIASADYGSTLRVQVTGSNSAGQDTALSSATITVGPQAPANSALPVISDLNSNSPPIDEDTLSVSNGSWTGTAPLGYTYVWQRCDSSGNNCSAISGAGSAQKLLNGGFESGTGSWTATSATVTQVASPVAQGAASGRVVSSAAATFGVNQSVSDSGSTTGQVWDGMAAVYATGNTVGKTFQLQLAEEGGASGNTNTAATVVMVAGWNYLTVSRTFTANDRTAAHLYVNVLGGASGDTVYVDMGYLSLDGSTYTLQHADLNDTIRAVVTAINPTATTNATSAQTGVIQYKTPVNMVAPALTDTSYAGRWMQDDVLSTDNGTWDGSPTITYTYQWQRSTNGGSSWSNIGGATSSTYQPTQSDVTYIDRACVTATNLATPPSATSCTSASGTVISDIPVGVIVPYAGTVAGIPSGWHLADGTCGYTSAANPDLWSAIGTTYGGTSGNFCLPDLRGRIPLGQAASGTGSTLGASGGSMDETGVTNPWGTVNETFNWSETPPNPAAVAHTHTVPGSPAALSNSMWPNFTVYMMYASVNGTCCALKATELESLGNTNETWTASTISGLTASGSVTPAVNWSVSNPPVDVVRYLVKTNAVSTVPCGAVWGYGAATIPGTASRADGLSGSTCLDPGFAGSFPDLRGYFPLGQAASGTYATLDTSTGSLTESLSGSLDTSSTQASVTPAAYSAQITEGTHTHTYNGTPNASGGNGGNPNGTAAASAPTQTSNNSNAGAIYTSAAFNPGTLTTNSANAQSFSSTSWNPAYEAISYVGYGSSSSYQLSAGAIAPYGGSTAPYGWLKADGTCYSTATYPNLFAAIGYTYGGSGASFCVPDLRGRFPYGQATYGSGSSLGQNAGTLAPSYSAPITGWTPQITIPQHTFSFTVPTHTHTLTFGGATTLGNASAFIGQVRGVGTGTTSAAGGGTVTSTVNANTINATAAFANTNFSPAVTPPPYLATTFIINYNAAATTQQSAPSNTALPVIGGTIEEGQQATNDNGSWSGTGPFIYSYQWLLCDSNGNNCSPISGANQQTFTIPYSTGGQTLRVVVTAQDGTGQTQATSNKATIIPEVPVGAIVPYAGTAAGIPTGWVVADGSCGYTQAGNPDLWTTVGSTYGGNSSNFCLPNMTGTIPLGQATSGTGSTLGSTGGTMDQTGSYQPWGAGALTYNFSWNETPPNPAPIAHTHTLTGGTNGQSGGGGTQSTLGQTALTTASSNLTFTSGTTAASTSGSATPTAAYSISNTGYDVVRYLIKVANTPTIPCGTIWGYGAATIPSAANRSDGSSTSSCLDPAEGGVYPDLRGYMPLDQASSGTYSTIDTTGGSIDQTATATLNVASTQASVNPSYSATITAGSHTHTATWSGGIHLSTDYVYANSDAQGVSSPTAANSNAGTVYTSATYAPPLSTDASAAQTGSSATFNTAYNTISYIGYGNSTNYRISAGTITAYGGSTVPYGWLKADGSCYSTTGTYANLFATIGYTYGGAAGSFCVPDLRGRFPYGQSTYGTGSSLGTSGGTLAPSPSINLPGYTPTLTIPQHTFTWTVPAHTHVITETTPFHSGDSNGTPLVIGKGGTSWTSGTTTATSSAAGGGSPTSTVTAYTVNATSPVASANSAPSSVSPPPYTAVTFLINYTGSATTQLTPPANTVAPAISGVAQDGQTVSASTGTWTGTGPFNYSYHWQQCDSVGNNCQAISGATSSSYQIPYSFTDSTLKVTVTAQDTTGQTQATSAAFGLISSDSPSCGASLPVAPVDGQECSYVADAVTGVVWDLKYQASSGDWFKIGGPPLSVYVAGPVSTPGSTSTSPAFSDISGASTTVPLSGSYLVGYGSEMSTSGGTGAAGTTTWNYLGLNDAGSIVDQFNASTQMYTGYGTYGYTATDGQTYVGALNSGDTLKLQGHDTYQYGSFTVSANYTNTWMTLDPVYLAGSVGTSGSNGYTPIGTSLPASPADGYEYDYIADQTNGIVWHLKYDATSGQWRKIGGPPLISQVATSESTTSTTAASPAYQDLTTVGPSINVPLTGAYTFSYGSDASGTAPTGGTGDSSISYQGLMIGGVTADEFATQTQYYGGYSTSPDNQALAGSYYQTATVSSGTTVKTQYRSWYQAATSGSQFGTYADRWLTADPLFISASTATANSAIPRGTSLPASPTDGQEYDYVVDATNGIQWRLKYDQASGHWRKIGGAPLVVFASGSASTTGSTANSPAFSDIAGGPSATIPLNGVFRVGYGAASVASHGATGGGAGYCGMMWAYMGVNAAGSIGNSVATDTQLFTNVGPSVSGTLSRQTGISGFYQTGTLTAGSTVKAQYHDTVNSNCSGGPSHYATYTNRWISIDPVWVN